MNINQQQSCLDSINEIESIDGANIISTFYTEENDLSKIVFSKYNAALFIELFDKMLSQLRYELNQGLKLLLPNAENYQNDFGAINLTQELPLFKQYFEGHNFTHLETLLDKFIHYQIKNGFWNKTVVKASVIEQKKLNAQHKLITKNLESLNTNIDLFEGMRKDFSQVIEEAEGIIEAKNTELNTIAQNLQTSTNQTNEITTLLSDVTNKDTEIAGILHNIKDKVTTIETDITNYQEAFNIIETNWEDLEKSLNTNILEAKSNFETSKEHIEYTESKKDQIEKLTGMAADGALGSKFHQREEKLTDKIPFWRWSIIGMTLLSVVWVVVVFTCLPAKFDSEWVNLGVNLLKTTPVFILLGFVFKQYAKERNLEEEYAFKSAVAMTLTAYSSMLSDGDRDHNDSKQKMLLASIERLYTQPRIHSEKKGTLFSFNTKHLKDTVETLNKSVNDLKD